MATADQLKALIKSHLSKEHDHFVNVALQIAAYESKKGHTSLAVSIRNLLDKAEQKQVKVIPMKRDLSDLLIEVHPQERLNSLVSPQTLKGRLERVIREYRQQQKLKYHGLSPRRKLLLAGPPGTGKTLTASVLANELKLPLYLVMMDRMVTKYMGETTAKLRLVFEAMIEMPGVFLFDEFDAIGADREKDNDVGEMRRVLNAFLQFIEQDKSDAIIIAATNTMGVLDSALFRRFDDVFQYQIPDDLLIEQLIRNKLGTYLKNADISDFIESAHGLSHADISQACLDAMKQAVLEDRDYIESQDLVTSIQERQTFYS